MLNQQDAKDRAERIDAAIDRVARMGMSRPVEPPQRDADPNKASEEKHEQRSKRAG